MNRFWRGLRRRGEQRGGYETREEEGREGDETRVESGAEESRAGGEERREDGNENNVRTNVRITIHIYAQTLLIHYHIEVPNESFVLLQDITLTLQLLNCIQYSVLINLSTMLCLIDDGQLSAPFKL